MRQPPLHRRLVRYVRSRVDALRAALDFLRHTQPYGETYAEDVAGEVVPCAGDCSACGGCVAPKPPRLPRRGRVL